MGNPTVKEIVKQWLEANGFDGLFHVEGSCGCLVDRVSAFMPCDEPDGGCTAGYKIDYKADECPCGEGCTWHIGMKKPEAGQARKGQRDE